MMPHPNARVTLTDRAVSVVRDCLRHFDEGLDFNVDHRLTGGRLPEVSDRELGKGDAQPPPVEQKELAQQLARKEKAETIVERMRQAQLSAVHYDILREDGNLANKWRYPSQVIVDELPERFRRQLLGSDFTHEEFVRAWLSSNIVDPGIMRDLADSWQKWARKNGLHPSFPPAPTVAAHRPSVLIEVPADTHSRTEAASCTAKTERKQKAVPLVRFTTPPRKWSDLTFEKHLETTFFVRCAHNREKKEVTLDVIRLEDASGHKTVQGELFMSILEKGEIPAAHRPNGISPSDKKRLAALHTEGEAGSVDKGYSIRNPPDAKLKKQISRLREALKTAFGLDEDPFPHEITLLSKALKAGTFSREKTKSMSNRELTYRIEFKILPRS